MLTGGGSMFLNYAIGKHPQIKSIFNHHEQASAIAAEGYARILGNPGSCKYYFRPWRYQHDYRVHGRLPIYLHVSYSGQVKRETYIRTYDLTELRQLGDQEVDIISMVKGITKYAVTVTDPKRFGII